LISTLPDPTDGAEVDEIVVGQNCAFFTFDTLARTPNGVTSPIIVTFFAAKSMLKEVTPAHIIISNVHAVRVFLLVMEVGQL
jgi:hypothetical protein